MMETELLTVKDLADRLQISQRQCWKLLASERLPKPVRIGRSVRWSAAVIARWLEKLQAEAMSA